ncbi:MAG: primosomal protein N' [Pseudomonadota bacterium]
MEARIIRVAIPRPLRRLFDYELPVGMRAPEPGARVRVPFASRELVGVALELIQASDHDEPKAVLEVLDDEPALEPEMLELARWLARYYHYPLGEVCLALLPNAARRGASLTITTTPAWRLLAGADAAALGRAPRQRAALEALRDAGGELAASDLRQAGFQRDLLLALAERGFAEEFDQPPHAATLQRAASDVRLNAEQRAALERILATTDRFAAHLLYGITGSGKTEVYLQALSAVLAAGRQVLVLVPEIALTPQTLARFRARFGHAVALHSQLADGERLQTWLRCRAGLDRILIGTRSAILTPFADLGLIVIDEEHDPSFKQAEGLRYSARDLALVRARELGIPVVLGSATPALESLHNARTGRYAVSRLTERPGGASSPALRIVDIRGQRLEHGLSETLRAEVGRHLDAGGQALVFINRRGYAPVLFCTSCRWQAGCAHCDARQTLHQRPTELRCHHCGARARVPRACPNCNSTALVAVGTGTQRTEEALAEQFPDVPLLRIDRDTTRSAARLEAQLATIAKGEPALLVGTQMLAKGHHFPAVTLVAIVDADSGFLAADYRAPERAAALILQVAGRAGRAERPGEVLIQSLHPDNPVLDALVTGGYDAFAATELANREQGGLPPFAPIALLRADATDPRAAQALLRQLVAPLGAELTADDRLTVWGPAPAPLSRVSGRHRFQTLLRARERRHLHRALTALVAAAPPSRHGKLSWSLDVDPYDTY